MLQRPRRLRQNEILRNMVKETKADVSSLIYPIFIREGEGIVEPVPSMEGQYRYTVDTMGEKLSRLQEAGVRAVMFFGIPGEKDERGSQAYAEDGIVQRALRRARMDFPKMYLIGDVCMCEYTSHGHCGILKKVSRGKNFPEEFSCGCDVDNDTTLSYLERIAVSFADAGADMVAPSDMMDGRVHAIRNALDGAGYSHIPVMSYAVKYASSFYAPFRDAAGSAPSFGNRKTYQMDYHNRREAVKEALLDVEEGADIIMVKPAMTFLDIVREVRDTVHVPVAAYSVSGEYAMVKAAAKAGVIDEEQILCEMAVGAFRAGADIYLTYYAEELAGMIKRGML